MRIWSKRHCRSNDMKVFRYITFIALLLPFFSAGQPGEVTEGDGAIPDPAEEDGGAIPDGDGSDTPPVVETNLNEYASKEYGIYFTAPEGWTLTKKPERGGLFEVSDANGEITVRCYVTIIKYRVDIKDHIEKQEKSIGLFKRGKVVREMLEDSTLSAGQRDVLSAILYDDYDKINKKREKWEKEQKRLAEEAAATGIQPEEQDEPAFRRRIETRIYDTADGMRKINYWVVGGGVGYRFIVETKGTDFYANIPKAIPVISALGLERLDGGRYKLPSDEQIKAATKGMLMGKVLSNGKVIPGANVQVYSSKESYLRGEPKYSGRSNYYGEYIVKGMKPGNYYLVEVSGTSDEGELISAVQPVRSVNIGSGKVTLINLEVIVR